MQGPRLASHSSQNRIGYNTFVARRDQTVREEDDGDRDLVKTASNSSVPSTQDFNTLNVPKSENDDPPDRQTKLKRKWKSLVLVCKRHIAFLGPGLVAAVAYIDPGNWSTDLKAGADFGYSHLFIILMSGLFAICLQTLATRLGVVSGLDLPQHCRRALHSRPRHTLLWRWGVLYPLYVMCEIGIILTDLCELLGSAIAINLLIPEVPLYAGVLLTSLDVLIILALFSNYPSPNSTRSMRIFEFSIGALVAVVLGCFIVLLVKVQPDWSGVFRNYLPNSGFVRPGGLYIAIGIIGATVMPHALLLGSRIATVERYPEKNHHEIANGESVKPDQSSTHHVSYSLQKSKSAQNLVNDEQPTIPKTKRPEPTVSFIRAHVRHAGVDIALSLISFALVINSAILIVSAAAFHDNPDPDLDTGDLFDAHELIKRRLGPPFAFLFALALLLSGQLASITATLAGQVVSEGFLNWTIAPWKRRVITRLISIIPSIAVAVSAGRSGIDTLLVASQVGLSVILPFVIAPLMIFTSTTSIMSIRDYRIPTTVPDTEEVSEAPQATNKQKLVGYLQCINPFHTRRHPSNEYATFVNQPIVVIIGSFIFILVVAANVYAFVQLGIGESGP